MIKLYLFEMRNARGDSFSFWGQGQNRRAAEKEGLENCGIIFRPKQDGRKGKPGDVNGLSRIAVRRANGNLEFCSYKEFIK